MLSSYTMGAVAAAAASGMVRRELLVAKEVCDFEEDEMFDGCWGFGCRTRAPCPREEEDAAATWAIVLERGGPRAMQLAVGKRYAGRGRRGK